MSRYSTFNAEAEPWEIGDIAAHLARNDTDADALVLREIARRMAAAIPADGIDARAMALDLGCAVTSLIDVAAELLRHAADNFDDKDSALQVLADAQDIGEHLSNVAACLSTIESTF
jgi:hypothetical protein